MITLLVFSKDRALQCDSLLRSVKDHCTGVRVVVLAKASSSLHIDAYKKLRDEGEYDELTVNGENGGLPLGEDIFQAVNDSEHIALAVDDMTFYAPSDFTRAAKALDLHGFSWSWRLGEKPDPDHDRFDDDRDSWVYPAMMINDDPDYGYMFHCDGMVIKTENYLKMLDRYLPNWRTGAYTPNDLEAAVAAKKARWAAAVYPHRGPRTPTCITWQLNRVQTEYGSPVAEIPETTPNYLALAYLDGRRVDNEKLYTALREDPLQWNPPGARPTHVYACEEASKFWAGCLR